MDHALVHGKRDNDTTYGAILLGVLASAFLFGVTSVQTYLYFSNNSDGRTLRSLIGILWMLSATRIVCCTDYVYSNLITHFGDPLFILNMHLWVIPVNTIATAPMPPANPLLYSASPRKQGHIVAAALSDAIVRGIFTYRVSKFTRLRSLTALLVVLTLITFIGCTVYGVGIYSAGPIVTPALHTYRWLMDGAYGCAVIADVLLTASLCISLMLQRRSLLKRTDRVLTVLMLYAINTGALVGVFTIAELICYAAMPRNNIFTAVYDTLSDLYVNALLATLNARPHLRAHLANNTTQLPTIIAGEVILDEQEGTEAGLDDGVGRKAHTVDIDQLPHPKTADRSMDVAQTDGGLRDLA